MVLRIKFKVLTWVLGGWKKKWTLGVLSSKESHWQDLRVGNLEALGTLQKLTQKVVRTKERQVDVGPRSTTHCPPFSADPAPAMVGHSRPPCAHHAPSHEMLDLTLKMKPLLSPRNHSICCVAMWALYSTSYGWKLVLLLCSHTLLRTWLFFPLYLGDVYGDLKGTLAHGGIRFWSEEGWARTRKLGLLSSLSSWFFFGPHVMLLLSEECVYALGTDMFFVLRPSPPLTTGLGNHRSWDRLGRVTPGTEHLTFLLDEWNQSSKE